MVGFLLSSFAHEKVTHLTGWSPGDVCLSYFFTVVEGRKPVHLTLECLWKLSPGPNFCYSFFQGAGCCLSVPAEC